MKLLIHTIHRAQDISVYKKIQHEQDALMNRFDFDPTTVFSFGNAHFYIYLTDNETPAATPAQSSLSIDIDDSLISKDTCMLIYVVEHAHDSISFEGWVMKSKEDQPGTSYMFTRPFQFDAFYGATTEVLLDRFSKRHPSVYKK